MLNTSARRTHAPVRLLTVVPTLMCGGTENQVMTLSRSFDPERIDLEMACLRRIGPFVKEIEDRGIPLTEYRLESFRSLSTIPQQVKFARHLTQCRTDIVHAYNFYGNVFAIPPARLAGAPIVIASIRDLGLYLTPMQKRVQRYVCQFADRIVVNAEAVKEWLVRDGYDPAQIVVIHNGVDVSRFQGPKQRTRVRQELGIAADAPIVAVVSRLNRLKGLEQFLEAAAIVAGQTPAARFLIVGETPPFDPTYLDELRAMAAGLKIADRVIFTGLRSDVPALLRTVTVAVMPSLNEALSNALLESMASGAPVVATRVGGTPEAVVDGETGLLVPPGDVRALAVSIQRLLDAPALGARLGRSAQQLIDARFSIARMTSMTEALYGDLLARRLRAGEPQSIPPEPAQEARSSWLAH